MYDGTAVAEVLTTDAVAKPTGRPPCLHCGHRAAYGGRGLCRACHRDPAVLGQYPNRRNLPRGGKPHPRIPCRHCDKPIARTDNRGLCWTCYWDLSVRELYPRKAEDGLGTAPGHRPCKATRALPGSLRKMAVLRGRLRRGEELWHSRDGRRGEE